MGEFGERLKMVFRQPLYHTAQSLLRPPGLRRFFAAIEAKTRPAGTLALDTPRAREIYDALRTRGHTEDLRPFSDAMIKEMYDFLVSKPMADYETPTKVAFTYPDIPKNVHTAIYPLETVVRIPHLFEFAANPDYLAAIEHLFGCKPQIGVIQAFWRFPTTEEPVKDEHWHRDFETLRFLKSFLYLTDVTPDTGPHQFVEASHLINKHWKMGVASDQDIEKAYGKDQIISKLGRAGTCFIEETNGWHKGAQPKTGPRLAIQVVYSIRPCHFRDKPLVPAEEVAVPGFNAYLFQNHVLPRRQQ